MSAWAEQSEMLPSRSVKFSNLQQKGFRLKVWGSGGQGVDANSLCQFSQAPASRVLLCSRVSQGFWRRPGQGAGRGEVGRHTLQCLIIFRFPVRTYDLGPALAAYHPQLE